MCVLYGLYIIFSCLLYMVVKTTCEQVTGTVKNQCQFYYVDLYDIDFTEWFILDMYIICILC